MGLSPAVKSFGLIWTAKEGNFFSHGQPLSPQTDFHGLDRQREVRLVSSKGGMMTNIFIPVKRFEACANHLHRYDLDDRCLAKNHVRILPDRMGEIKDYLRQLFWLAENKADWLQQPHIPELVANDLVPLVIQAIPINCSATTPTWCHVNGRSTCFARHGSRGLGLPGLEQGAF